MSRVISEWKRMHLDFWKAVRKGVYDISWPGRNVSLVVYKQRWSFLAVSLENSTWASGRICCDITLSLEMCPNRRCRGNDSRTPSVTRNFHEGFFSGLYICVLILRSGQVWSLKQKHEFDRAIWRWSAKQWLLRSVTSLTSAFVSRRWKSTTDRASFLHKGLIRDMFYLFLCLELFWHIRQFFIHLETSS